MVYRELPLPYALDSRMFEELSWVDYEKVAREARNWAQRHGILPAASDRYKVALMIIDAQNTFCLRNGQLYVAGAEQDNRRLAEFIYRNLPYINRIFATLDTHTAFQIFHTIFFEDDQGNPPPHDTQISHEDIKEGKWRVRKSAAWNLGISYSTLQNHALHYTGSLGAANRYDLYEWPYHSILAGVGHALVAGIEEALWFHLHARESQTHFEVKGGNPLSEAYSVMGDEVQRGANNEVVGRRNVQFLKTLLNHDAVIIAGQAKSHCVAWTIDDMLTDIQAQDPDLAKKVYLLEDCTSPVVIPGIVDFTPQGDAAFDRFRNAGMNLVKSTTPMNHWPGIRL